MSKITIMVVAADAMDYAVFVIGCVAIIPPVGELARAA